MKSHPSQMEPRELTILWEACNPQRNMARSYRLTMAQDLFGWFTVERQWSRIGTQGSSLTASFERREEALAYCKQIIRKRSHSRKSLGANYKRI